MNRREAFQASRHHPLGGSSSSGGGGGGGGTILFLFFPLALLFYVWNTVQGEPNMIDPRDATFKKVGGGVGHEVWDVMDNETSTFGEDEEDVITWYNYNDEEEKKEAQLQEDMDEQIPITGLWIMVESWQPGMPHWQQALAEVVVLAKSLSAVLVEPSIANAELVPCHYQQQSNAMPLSHIYNRTRMIQFYPQLASCTKYEFAMNQLTAPKIWNVCFHPNSEDCEDDTFFQAPINTVLEDAMEFASTHPHNMVLLRFHSVWKSSLDALTLPVEPINRQSPTSSVNKEQQQQQQQQQPSKRTPPIIDHAMVTIFQTQHLEFATRQYQWLHAQLQAQGIPYASYAVIHWNPPPTTTTNTNITHCVDTILQVQRAMNLPKMTPFFLITTLPHVDMDGDGSVIETTTTTTTPTSVQTNQALDMLYQEHHFLKLETILPSWHGNNNKDEEVDAIIPIVMNLILAEQAFSFTTCATTTITSSSTTSTSSTVTLPEQNQPKKKKGKQQQQQQQQSKSCHQHFPLCETCHAGGIFGEWALALRRRQQDDNPNTFPCWPQTSSELPSIHHLWNNQG